VSPRLGFFTRLLDEGDAAARLRLATEQILHAEAAGFDTAWVAQHHFHAGEGGLPSPLVFLAHVAARTSRIKLGSAIITLPVEDPVRLAEDAAVLHSLSGGRLEIGVGGGGNPTAFAAFGKASAQRSTLYSDNLAALTAALAGSGIRDTGNVLYPAAPALADTLWEATFSASGAARIGAAGHGLMLSRTQPATPESRGRSLVEIQEEIVAAYLAALPAGTAPRVFASRTLLVTDRPESTLDLAEANVRRAFATLPGFTASLDDLDRDQLFAATDTHVGSVARVVDSLGRDTVLAGATDIVFQVHSTDPPHDLVMRSIELVAAEVAPQLGWSATRGD
jgi:putative FMN-dependent luciferase-like monooxygenase